MSYTYGSITNCKVKNGQTRKEYECHLGYQVNSQNQSNNTSNITLRLQVRSKNSAYKTSGKGQTTKIDGTTVASNKKFDMSDTGVWQTFGSKTITVTHNSDGTYSASKSGSFTATAGSSEYSLRSGSAKVTVKAPTIARESNPSLSSTYIDTGDSVTIYTNRKNSSFTHIAAISCGGYYKNVENIGDSFVWNTATDLDNDGKTIYQEITNTNKIDGTVLLTTFSNGKQLGSTKSVSFTLYIQDMECQPTLDGYEWGDSNEDTLSLTKNNHILIKGYSNLTVKELESTIKKYATFKSYELLSNNQSAISTVDSLETELTINKINSVGTFQILVRDSRNNTAGAFVTPQVPSIPKPDYSKIKINQLSLKRLNNHISAGGTEDMSGTATCISFSGEYWNNKFGDEGSVTNDITKISYYYRENGSDGEWIQGETSINLSSITKDGANISLPETDIKGNIKQDSLEDGTKYGFGLDKSYEVKLRIKDELDYTEVIGVVAAAKPYIEITDGEDGEGLVEFKVPIKFDKATGPQKILWSGALFMNQEQTVYLLENVSDQNNGIILVFSGYSTTTWEAQNNNWSSYFISKKEVELLPGSGHTFFMGGTEGLSGFKYLYISDDEIVGHGANQTVKNDDYGRYECNKFVLRYVIGI